MYHQALWLFLVFKIVGFQYHLGLYIMQEPLYLGKITQVPLTTKSWRWLMPFVMNFESLNQWSFNHQFWHILHIYISKEEWNKPQKIAKKKHDFRHNKKNWTKKPYFLI